MTAYLGVWKGFVDRKARQTGRGCELGDFSILTYLSPIVLLSGWYYFEHGGRGGHNLRSENDGSFKLSSSAEDLGHRVCHGCRKFET